MSVDMEGTASKSKITTGKRSVRRSAAVEPLSAVARGAQAGLRRMPESVAAEAAVLGSMLINPDCIGSVIEQLREDDFYRQEHRYIFSALIALYERHTGEAIDGVLLRDELEKRKQLDDAGGVEYIGKIVDSVPTSANVMYYAGIVKDKSLLRDIIGAAGEILEEAYEQSTETSETLDEAERKIFAITDKNIKGAVALIKDLVTRSFELIEKREGMHVTGIATGYHELDGLTCGFQNGEMIIIAGRPSMGKTSLALNMAEYMGVHEKVPVGVFSLEMGQQQLAERFLCSLSEVDGQRVRRGYLSSEEYERLKGACGQLYEVPIYVDDTSSMTPLELRAKARRLKSQHDIQCIIVDYLQLMHMGTRVESRQQEISTISRYIKALAGELKIPVIVLSQLNRSPEGRVDHRPRMSDLRESGSIEQDADMVILLHREDYYEHSENLEMGDNEGSASGGGEKKNTAELIIAKQRNGPTGTVPLVFRKKIMRFENASFVGESPGYGSLGKDELPPF